MNKSGQDRSLLKAAATASAIGMNVVACILIGYFGGSFLAGRTGHRGLLAAGVILGLVAGLGSTALMIKRILEESDG